MYFRVDRMRTYLEAGPRCLARALAQQRAMVEDRRRILETILRGIGETERRPADGKDDRDAVAGVIRLIQME
jgi:hypothetical protein